MEERCARLEKPQVRKHCQPEEPIDQLSAPKRYNAITLTAHIHVNLNLFEYMDASLTRLKSKSSEKIDGKLVSEVNHKVKTSGYQLRTVIARSENGTVVGQIGWDGRNLNHVHCKVCDSEWTEGKGFALDTKFETFEMRDQRLHFKCKNCQREFDSG